MTDNISFLIVTATPKPDKLDRLHDYIGQALPVLMAAGGNPIGRYRTVQHLAGDNGPGLVAILEFPSSRSIRDALASEAFHATDHMREEIFERIDIVECASM